jgi:hypothetical protein
MAVTASLGLVTNIVGGQPQVDQMLDFTRGTAFGVDPVHHSDCDVCTLDHGLRGLGDRQIVSAYE